MAYAILFCLVFNLILHFVSILLNGFGNLLAYILVRQGNGGRFGFQSFGDQQWDKTLDDSKSKNDQQQQMHFEILQKKYTKYENTVYHYQNHGSLYMVKPKI